ncbi:late blight resistance protein R1A-3 [Artemisia annua]|uniref:Late blight resistance protein R1A-3 n=1 Tax=Artemisia annua TaxID=35608 RepID=A0A2U1NKJ3_ARTAN|nr:late blight resistance protein R1A-3 [Artemisia annua]
MAEPKIVVFGVSIHDNKEKRKLLKAIASVKGINSIDMNMNDKKLTVIGFFDPLRGVKRLKKGRSYVGGKVGHGPPTKP